MWSMLFVAVSTTLAGVVSGGSAIAFFFAVLFIIPTAFLIEAKTGG